MVNCCVPNCKSDSRKKEGYSFPQFPKDLSLREEWLKKISRKERRGVDSPDWDPTAASVVCSRHFLHSDFSISTKRKQLNPGAVPTVFPEFPKYLQSQPKNQPRKRNRLEMEKSETCRTTQAKKFKISIDAEITSYSETGSYSAESASVNYSNPTDRCSSVSVQVDILNNDVIQKYKKTSLLLKRQNRRMRQTITALKKRLKTTMKCLQKIKKQEKWKQIKSDARDGIEKAILIEEQVAAYGQKRHRWPKNVLRICLLWYYRSPSAYRYVRQHQILTIPSPSTLKKYVGFSTAEVGITSLIRERLDMEVKKLNDKEIFGSINFDEMAIKPQQKYLPTIDKLIGTVDLGELGAENVLANRLLCFVFVGLSTKIVVPVAYFFTRQLNGETLQSLILQVIRAVEDSGLTVVRLVCDNHKTNVKAYHLLSNGNIAKPNIPHPLDHSRPLFLSYDSSHIIKNLSKLLLHAKKNLKNDGQKIDGGFIKKLYHLQKNHIVKLVRYLTRKHVYPSNLESMNVLRAVQIFSPQIQAALLYLNKIHAEFHDVQGTVTFLQNIHKWFQLNDVSNTTQWYHKRDANSAPFWSPDDPRLKWLEKDFLEWIENWKAKASSPSEFITKETSEALILTTCSLVQCVRYLLLKGFNFVLTRHLNGDNVERLFSQVRQLQGNADQGHAAGTLFALEKILKTGIIKAAHGANVSVTDPDAYEQTALVTNTIAHPIREKPLVLSAEDISCLNDISRPPVIPCSNSLEVTSLTLICGYLCRRIQDRHPCPLASSNFQRPASNSGHYLIVNAQDRGGLSYPQMSFVQLTFSIYLFVKQIIPNLHNVDSVVHQITELVSPKVNAVEWFHCGCKSSQHKTILIDLIIPTLIKILVVNSSQLVNDMEQVKINFNKKPISRKLIKIS